MAYHSVLASQASRLEALKSRHAALSYHIKEEQQYLSSHDEDVKQMKLKRLIMKEEIQELEENIQETASA